MNGKHNPQKSCQKLILKGFLSLSKEESLVQLFVSFGLLLVRPSRQNSLASCHPVTAPLHSSVPISLPRLLHFRFEAISLLWPSLRLSLFFLSQLPDDGTKGKEQERLRGKALL